MPNDDERKFLHDIANPLSIAQGNLKIAVRKLDVFKDQDPGLKDILDRLSKALEACEKMAKQVADHRQALMDAQNSVAS